MRVQGDRLIAGSRHSVAAVGQYRLSRQGYRDAGLDHPPFVVGGYVWSLRRSGHTWADISVHLEIGVARARAAQEVVLAYFRGEMREVPRH